MCDSNGNHDTCTCDTTAGHEHDHSGHEHGHSSAAVTAEYGVEGMTCSHCVSSVTKELSQLEGVTNVDIDLVAGGISRVRVGSDRTLDNDVVAAAVDEAGYELAALPR
ncbi:heavy-metal-associated domain-containing protein [Agromyces mediolanus]|uniref:heavy-metal-associated domain-containing protein n=1 Tax=Agromyces mediolanus TaxID=41986 RepID=UPI0038386410